MRCVSGGSSAELTLNDGNLLLRGDYDQSRFVVGIGFAFSGVRLDLATGSKPQEQAALSLTFGGR